MKKISLFALSTLLICLTLPARASLIIDQNQPSADVMTPMAIFYQGDLAQSFQQASDNVAGAGIYLFAGRGSTDTVTISLWDALPNQSGNLLASASGAGTPGSWFDVFWDPVSVTPNTTLFLVFTSDNGSLAISGDQSNPYNRGNTFATSGFGAFTGFDYTFRTYANTIDVPEPGSLTLVGLGILLIGLLTANRQEANPHARSLVTPPVS